MTMVRKQMISDIQAVLNPFGRVIRSWITADGRLADPYETEYSENYAPANASVVLASICRFNRTEESAELLKLTLVRSVELLQDKEGVSPFCRVFLYHYSLMALILAPEPDRKSCLELVGDKLARYEDDCTVVNTNCAALQWAMEMFTEVLGLRSADPELLEHRLRFIAGAQLESGFINDEVDLQQSRDGMPIAYHAFTLFLLTSPMAIIEQWPESLASCKAKAERIVSRGMSWLGHAISEDGTFAMAGRSSYQMFTWGALVALLACTASNEQAESGSDFLLSSAFQAWLPYRHLDGTYSCTPNYWPHSLRVGYESYTHLNMYNLLGLTGLVVAERGLGRNYFLKEQRAEQRIPEYATSTPHQHGNYGGESGYRGYVDPASGYAFFRKGGSFFGCTLRMHSRKYAAAMQGFHFRLNGKPLPLAEPRLPGPGTTMEISIYTGAWEGFLICDEEGQLHYPDLTDNATVFPLDDGFKLVAETDKVRCEKTIRLLDDSVQWGYRIEAKTGLRFCEQVVPLTVHNGRDVLQYTSTGGNRLEFTYAGQSYALQCEEANSLQMELSRSDLSSSGISAKVHARITGPLPAGGIVKWQTTLGME